MIMDTVLLGLVFVCHVLAMMVLCVRITQEVVSSHVVGHVTSITLKFSGRFNLDVLHYVNRSSCLMD